MDSLGEILELRRRPSFVELRGLADRANVAVGLRRLHRCVLHVLRFLLLDPRDDFVEADGRYDAVDKLLVLLRCRRSRRLREVELHG